MKRLFHIILLAGCFLAGCGPLALAPARAQQSTPALPFILVTAAPNASPTPTPFQPIPWTPTGTSPESGVPQPVVDTATPSVTLPPSTQTLPPTADPNMLLN